MSQENVELAVQVLGHISRRDWAAVVAAYDPDAVVVVHESVGPNPGTLRGRDAIGGWFADWFLAFGKDYRFEVLESRDLGDRVLTVTRHRGRGRHSGVDVDRVMADIQTMRDGKVVKVEVFG